MNKESQISLTDKFYGQLSGMKKNESRVVNLMGKSAFCARPLIKYASEKLGYNKIRTRIVDGEFVVLRVS